MQKRHVSLWEDLLETLSLFRADFLSYKTYLDLLDDIIRQLNIENSIKEKLIDHWFVLEIIYALLYEQQRTVLTNEEMKAVEFSLDEMAKIAKDSITYWK